MPKTYPDLFAAFVDQLADAIVARLQRAPVAAKAPATSVRRRKGEKRSPKLLARLTSDLLGHIKAHPGERIEQIAAKLGHPTADLRLPAQKLLAAKKVKTKGTRRGTKYFVA